LQLTLAALLIVSITTIVVRHRSEDEVEWVDWWRVPDQVAKEGEGPMWGWSERMGWVQDESKGLVELEDVDGKYRLGIDYSEHGIQE
jgi:hypothetical protein